MWSWWIMSFLGSPSHVWLSVFVVWEVITLFLKDINITLHIAHTLSIGSNSPALAPHLLVLNSLGSLLSSYLTFIRQRTAVDGSCDWIYKSKCHKSHLILQMCRESPWSYNKCFLPFPKILASSPPGQVTGFSCELIMRVCFFPQDTRMCNVIGPLLKWRTNRTDRWS